VLKPVIDHEKCVACGLCVSYCPEAAIDRRGDKKPEIDYRFCKGCGVCANECPQKAIEMRQEEA
jgi:pyruvate ferredoxin oxidoreductase delta subunit